jgi:hypothetical protein
LRDEDIEADLLKLRVSEILERICGYLEIAPDWERGQSGPWAIAEAEAQLPGSPYAAPRREQNFAEAAEPDRLGDPVWGPLAGTGSAPP